MSLSKSDFEDWRNAVMQASKVVPVKVEDDNLDGKSLLIFVTSIHPRF